jgi:hypothetical protein
MKRGGFTGRCKEGRVNTEEREEFFFCFYWMLFLHLGKLMPVFIKYVTMGAGVMVLFIVSVLT